MKVSKVIITYQRGFDDLIAKLKQFLEINEIKYTIYSRQDLLKRHFKNVDLVISIGGDGTFLRASHHVFDSTPILGINPKPGHKEGFFNEADLNDFDKKINMIRNNQYTISKLNRLTATIDGKEIDDIALNEFYFGQEKAYHMAKYELSVNDKTEIQKSSGVLIGTAQSCTSWLGSAGCINMTKECKDFQFIVREPYKGQYINAKIVQGMIKENASIVLKPLREGFVLTVDSLQMYEVPRNGVVEIKRSKHFLNYFTF